MIIKATFHHNKGSVTSGPYNFLLMAAQSTTCLGGGSPKVSNFKDYLEKLNPKRSLISHYKVTKIDK